MNNFEWVALASQTGEVYADGNIIVAHNDVSMHWAPSAVPSGIYTSESDMIRNRVAFGKNFTAIAYEKIPKNPMSKFKLTPEIMKREGDSTFISLPFRFKSIQIKENEFNLEPLVLEFDNHYLDAILSGEDEFPDAECDNSRDGLVIKHRNGRCAMILPKHYPCNP